MMTIETAFFFNIDIRNWNSHGVNDYEGIDNDSNDINDNGYNYNSCDNSRQSYTNHLYNSTLTFRVDRNATKK